MFWVWTWTSLHQLVVLPCVTLSVYDSTSLEAKKQSLESLEAKKNRRSSLFYSLLCFCISVCMGITESGGSA